MLTLHQILVPLDDTELSDRVLEHALTLAERFGSHLHLLHISPDTHARTLEELARNESALEADHDALVLRLKRRLREGHSIPPDRLHAEVRRGDVLQCILASANAKDVDLIVMGTHGRHGLTDAILGSTTEQVVVKARQSVWVVRQIDPL